MENQGTLCFRHRLVPFSHTERPCKRPLEPFQKKRGRGGKDGRIPLRVPPGASPRAWGRHRLESPEYPMGSARTVQRVGKGPRIPGCRARAAGGSCVRCRAKACGFPSHMTGLSPLTLAGGKREGLAGSQGSPNAAFSSQLWVVPLHLGMDVVTDAAAAPPDPRQPVV